MDDPYKVLELIPGCGEEEIRNRYLELVRQFPPDRDPARFAAIRDAYEQLRDPVKRLQTMLFRPGAEQPLEALRSETQRRLRAARIPTDVLLDLAKRK